MLQYIQNKNERNKKNNNQKRIIKKTEKKYKRIYVLKSGNSARAQQSFQIICMSRLLHSALRCVYIAFFLYCHVL